MDVRGYWLGCGDTVQKAFRQLIDNVQATEQETRYQRRRGIRIIRWHCYKQPDVQKTLREAEAKARKHGFILEGVDWKNSLVSKALRAK
jgi:aminoglycoside phosphotransferase (APT) family kinase protein